MGLREVVLFGFMLLLSGGNPCAATQNWSYSIPTNETGIPQEQVTTSSLLPTSLQTAGRQSNRTEHGRPVTYRLKTYQLRSSAVRKQKDQRTSQNPQLEPEAIVPAQEPLKPMIQGPDLNPPVEQESKVLMLTFEQRVPVPAGSVAARCGEEEVTVEVKQDFLGNGQLIRPGDLTLGGCAARGAAHHILFFQAELQGCGSTVTMTVEALVYSFSLLYSPTPIGNTFIYKTSPAEVAIECHYRRRHDVSGGAMRPTWQPFASNMLAEQQLHFSLRLVTEDWQLPRPSGVFFLGDVMHIEAAVLQGHHVPLRVYVDSCVATVTPDPNSQPRLPFISNHGCLSDTKLTGAKSYFMQRSQEDKLHFKLKAFRFHQDHRNSLYLTCRLKATKVSDPIDSQHKACSFLSEANRWVASGGDNKVCGCCETSCSKQRQKRSLAADADPQWEETVVLGPVLLEDLNELSKLQTHEVTQAASHSSLALLCGLAAALAMVLLHFIATVVYSRRNKPAGHFVSI